MSVLFAVKQGIGPQYGQLGFDPLNYSVSETSGTVTLTVSRVGGSDGAVGCTYETVNGSALAGTHYTYAVGTLSWADGDAADKTIDISVLNDGVDEGNHDFGVTLSGATGNAKLDGDRQTANVTVTSASSSGTIQYTLSTYEVAEDGGTYSVGVSRVGGSSGVASVQVDLAGGTAVSGTDYTGGPSWQLSWPDGNTAIQYVQLTIIDRDGVAQGNKTVNFTLNNIQGASYGTPRNATLTIIDQDAETEAGTLQFNPSNYSVNEDDGSVSVTVTRTGGSIGAASAIVSVTGGTAVEDTDYSLSGTTTRIEAEHFTLTGFAYTTYNSTDCIYLPNDGDTGTMTYTYQGPSGTATVTWRAVDEADGQTTISWTLNDVVQGSFTLNNDDDAFHTFDFTGIAINTGDVISATITGNAGERCRIDYVEVVLQASNQVSWVSGDATSKVVTITIIDRDGVSQGNKSLALTLGSVTGATLGSPSTANISIVDQDPVSAGAVSFSSSSSQVSESAGTHTVAVNRTGGSAGAASVDVVINSGATSEYPDSWTSQGIILSEGSSGSWDVRFEGALSPCCAILHDGTYYLYYVGADGNRTTDGGPAHRKIGVATSDDGVNFTKYAGNPIIEWSPYNNQEEGAFSGAVIIVGGTWYMYYAAVESVNSTSEVVHSSVRLATSSDGLDWTDQAEVLNWEDGSVYGSGDELFPVGAYYHNGQWNVYYIARSSGFSWHLCVAYGDSATNLSTTADVNVSGGYDDAEVFYGHNGWAVLLAQRENMQNNLIELREIPSPFSPQTLGSVLDTYSLPNSLVDNDMALIYDSANGKYWLYHQNTDASDDYALSTFQGSSGGNAVSGTDYTATSPQTLSWSDGETGSKNASFTIIDRDGVQQGSKTISLSLSNESTVSLGGVTSHTITITDDDSVSALRWPTQPTHHFLPCYPGVRGFGTHTTHGSGRGGTGTPTIARVTAMVWEGSGGLKEATDIAKNNSGPTIVVFERSGFIDLGGNRITLQGSNWWIAGETAPSPGVALGHGTVHVAAEDAMISHITFANGDTGGDDALCLCGSTNRIVIKNCSMFWSVDGLLDAYQPPVEFTYWRCLVAEGLNKSWKSIEHGGGILVNHNNLTNRKVTIAQCAIVHPGAIGRIPFYQQKYGGFYNCGAINSDAWYNANSWGYQDTLEHEIIGCVYHAGYQQESRAMSWVRVDGTRTNGRKFYYNDVIVGSGVGALDYEDGASSSDISSTELLGARPDGIIFTDAAKVPELLYYTAGARPAETSHFGGHGRRCLTYLLNRHNNESDNDPSRVGRLRDYLSNPNTSQWGSGLIQVPGGDFPSMAVNDQPYSDPTDPNTIPSTDPYTGNSNPGYTKRELYIHSLGRALDNTETYG